MKNEETMIDNRRPLYKATYVIYELLCISIYIQLDVDCSNLIIYS